MISRVKSTHRTIVLLMLLSAAGCTTNGSSSASNATPTNLTSPAPVTVKVPDLVQLTVDQAKSLLKGAALSMKVSKVATGGYEHAVVWKQKPSAGSSVDAGSVVRVTIGPVTHG
jgi:hypothetical protein